MSQACCLCGVFSGESVWLHPFPTEESRRIAWFTRMNMIPWGPFVIKSFHKLCNSHFTPSSYAYGKALHKDAVPTLLPWVGMDSGHLINNYIKKYNEARRPIDPFSDHGTEESFPENEKLSPIKMVIILRTGSQVSTGKMASRAARAAVTSFQSSLGNCNPHLDAWLENGQPNDVLGAHSDKLIEKICKNAISNDLNVCMINDQMGNGKLTAIGIGPCRSEDVDKLTCECVLLL